MITFEKDIEKMSLGELRRELMVTRRIIDDIHKLTVESLKNPTAKTTRGKQNIINQIAHYCFRKMPK